MAGAATLLYALLLLGLYLGQGWMVLPGRVSQGAAFARFKAPAGTRFVRFTTSQGEPVAALYGPALNRDGSPCPDAPQRPTLLLFYGTGSWLHSFLPRFQHFRRYGVNVLTPEYVGYGLSGGSASEAGCYRTADAAHQYLTTQPGAEKRRLLIAGISLGGAVAIDLASRKPASGLVTVSTFTTMTAMATRKHPYAFPWLLLRERFQSSSKMARVRCPILMFHGTADPLVPHAMMGALAASATVPVTQVDVPRADHENVFSIGGAEPDTHLRSFLKRVAGAVTPSP